MLKTGDIVPFNRQPTLSKNSILSLPIIVDKGGGKNTGRNNPLTAKPYNEDFDGTCLLQ